MIFEFNKTTCNPRAVHEIKVKGKVVGTAQVPCRREGTFMYDNHIYELSIRGLREIDITKDGAPYITIFPRFVLKKKILFVIKTGYGYYEINTDVGQYRMYESGLGANKHFYTLYEGDKVVGAIHKPDHVVNYLDYYYGYLEDETFFIPLCLWCLFLEATEYFQIDAIGNHETWNETITVQEEEKNKYNPDFIERVIAKEENKENKFTS